MKAIILFMITVLCSIFTINAQPYPVPGATQQPAWVFPIWIEDGSGQKDSVYFGYDPNSSLYFGGYYWMNPPSNQGASDTAFGEYWLPQPTSGFFVSNGNWNDSIRKVDVTPWGWNGNIYLNNAIWPITLKYDVSLFYADALPFSDTIKPEVYAEFWCGDTWPDSDFNCNLQEYTYLITDTAHNYFSSWPYIKPDSIVLTGNNVTTSPNGMSINIYFKDIYSLISSVTEDKMMDEIKIFPNPATDIITISSNIKEPFNLIFYNFLGEEIFSKNNLPDQSQIPIAHLSPGLYLLKISGPGSEQIIKLFKT